MEHDSSPSQSKQALPIDIETLASSIAKEQRSTGEIPWHEGGKTDPWDHVEAAIGLTIGGYYEEARKAFEWLASIQLEDGSWHSSYINGIPEDLTKESNMSSYIAVGVFHHYLITQDRPFLEYIWPTVSAGIDYAVDLQAPGGEIYWARNYAGNQRPECTAHRLQLHLHEPQVRARPRPALGREQAHVAIGTAETGRCASLPSPPL